MMNVKIIIRIDFSNTFNARERFFLAGSDTPSAACAFKWSTSACSAPIAGWLGDRSDVAIWGGGRGRGPENVAMKKNRINLTQFKGPIFKSPPHCPNATSGVELSKTQECEDCGGGR